MKKTDTANNEQPPLPSGEAPLAPKSDPEKKPETAEAKPETKPEEKPSTALVAQPVESAPEGMISAFANETNFAAGQRIAKALAASTLVPREYQSNIPNILIAMELASRVGASVLMVMQNLNIIHGKPSWGSAFLIATVNASKRFTPLRFRFQGKEGEDAWGCRAYAKDAKTGEECIGSLVTIALAKAEQWYQKSGSKWKTMPEQMLMYRAAAFWTRVYAPEISLGIQSSDEIEDVWGPRDAPESIRNGNAKELEGELLGKPASGGA